MKKADIRTTATLNIHEKRMKELMDHPHCMAKTDASAAAYKEITGGALDVEVKAEFKRLADRFFNRGKKGATDMTKKIETTINPNIPGIVIERQKEEIAGLYEIIDSRNDELNKLQKANNAGAEEVYGLKKEILRLTDQVGDQGIKIREQAETIKRLANEIKDDERAIEDLKGYKKIAEAKVEELRAIDFNPVKFGIAPSGRKAEIFDEILDAITKTEFDILKVKVNARAIEIVKAEFAERGIEIEW